MVQEHRSEYPSLWAAVESIAPKIGCAPNTLHDWVKRSEIDAGVRQGVTTNEAQRVKDLEREVKELRRANEILKLASAFFAQAEQGSSLLHHSDRGSQYVSIRYTERLAEAGIEPSVGSKGDSYDNALAETINGLYKAELIHRRAPWKTRESVELATLEWVSWFNHHRLLEPIGYISPVEAEANYYRQLASQATTVAA